MHVTKLELTLDQLLQVSYLLENKVEGSKHTLDLGILYKVYGKTIDAQNEVPFDEFRK